jgi:hypothetical protein
MIGAGSAIEEAFDRLTEEHFVSGDGRHSPRVPADASRPRSPFAGRGKPSSKGTRLV